jgi:hypothetical protein
MERRRSNFVMVEAALKHGAIIVPPEMAVPPARHERAVAAMIDSMLAEGRRLVADHPPRRGDRSGTLH